MTKLKLTASCLSGLFAIAMTGNLMLPPQALLAQTMVSPAFQKEAKKPEIEQQQVQKKDTTATDNQINITSAGAPDPLLRYRLWPAAEKRRNASVDAIMSRAIILTIQASNSESGNNGVGETNRREIQEWQTMPLSQLPIAKVKKHVSQYGFALDELKRGESLMRSDYELHLEDLTTPELYGTLLPELQEARHLARVLALRARTAAAEQRWEDMIDDCRLGFRLADITGKRGHFLISRLVGQAIASVMQEVIEDAITQGDPPNFYWALASVPTRQIYETQDAIDFEGSLVSRMIKTVGKLPDTPIGEERARRKLREIMESNAALSQTLAPAESATTQLLMGVFTIAVAEQSRQLLANTAQWKNRTEELSNSECVLRATVLEVKRMRDAWIAWSYLPDYLNEKYSVERDKLLNDAQGSLPSPAKMILLQILPAFDSVTAAELRGIQKHNLLQTLEALRMHASQSGELPTTIENLHPVPALQDPITQRNFVYTRSSPTTATIQRSPTRQGDLSTELKITLKGTR